MKIENSAVQLGFENELTSKDNNRWMWLPSKCTERRAIIDVGIILKPLEITYNEEYLPIKDLPLPGEPCISIYLTNDPPPLKKYQGMNILLSN